MSLLTFEDARPWAKAIRAAVLAGKMPPWSPDPKYGKFSNDLSLAPGEKEMIAAWVDGGAVEGRSVDAPKPKIFPRGWQILKPDAVFEMPEPFEVPAAGAVEYQFIRVPTNFTEDKWVEMAEVRPAIPRWCITRSWWWPLRKCGAAKNTWAVTLPGCCRKFGNPDRRNW